MPVRRKTQILTTGLVALLGLSACGGETETATGSDEASANSETEIAAVIKGLDNPFFQAMEDGIRDAAADVTIQAAQSISDTTGQADRLTALAGEGFDCYIVNPISGNNLLQGVAQLTQNDKTVVNIDRPIDIEAAEKLDAVPDTYIGTDNVSAGKLAGEHMAELIPENGKVAIVGGIAGDITSGNRITGFKEGLGEAGNVIQTVAGNWAREEALTQATIVLRAQPELAGFFVANDQMALGVARAVANEGRTGEIEIISVDGTKQGLHAVRDGKITATVAQYPYAIGKMGVQACKADAAGAELPDSVEAPVELITEDKVEKAIEAAPKPFTDYENPFDDLLNK